MNLLLMGLLTLFTAGCGEKTETGTTDKVDFSIEYLETDQVLLKAQVEGYYEFIEWVIEGKSIYHNDEVTKRFYNNGKYDIELRAWSQGQATKMVKTVTITGASGGGEVLWAEEFDGTTLNANVWTIETGVRVNNELQEYVDSKENYRLENGVLTIIGKKVNDNKQYGSYTSLRLKTQGKKSFRYGRIEARLRLPKGRGLWPAFWMLGEKIGQGTAWPRCGEIDIMEYVGKDPRVIVGSLHCQDYNFTLGDPSRERTGRTRLSDANDEGQWHTYGVVWDTRKISFYVDDPSTPFYTAHAPVTKTEDNWAFDNDYFILLNLAIGGDWGGDPDNSIFPAEYQIDYIRHYAK